MKLSKNGSIYWLAKLGNNNENFIKSDLCTTTRKVFFGILYSIFITIMAVYVLMGVGYIPFYILLWIVSGTALMTETLSVFIVLGILASIALIGYSLFKGVKYVKKETTKKLESVEFIQTAYKGFKEKVCFMVEVK